MKIAIKKSQQGQQRSKSSLTEGVSLMRAFEQNKSLKFTGLVLLLMILAAATAGAQSWPAPTVPPAPSQVPAYASNPTGFEMTGWIEYASVDQMCLPNPNPTPENPPAPDGCKTSGGYIQVNGIVVRVPANTVVQFPANTLTWEEVFELNPTGVAGETGMALADSVRLPGTYEATVQGNIVDGHYISGLVFLAQSSLMGFQGFIEGFDYKNGIAIVNGYRVQIDDPAAKFSGGYASWDPIYLQDERFSIDENNPTIKSETAYPLCIPRTDPLVADDPLCPQRNRPHDGTGIPLRIWTMDPLIDPGTGLPPIGYNGDPTQPPTDPTVFAPLKVGDWVDFGGELLLDSNGQPYILAHTFTANLGIFTFPGTDPAYVAIDVILEGTGGAPNPAFPQEAGIRTKVEGFTTDDSRGIDTYAIDIDCNGKQTPRLPLWAANFPVDPGPPTGAVKGRWRWRPNGGNFLPPAMVVGAAVSGSVPTVWNPTLDILTNQYQAPNFEFIFAENLGIGNPMVAFNFRDFPFLVNGIGTWPPADNIVQGAAGNPNGFTNQVIGQLNPFPDVTAPPQGCQTGVGTAPATAVADWFVGVAGNQPAPVATGTVVSLTAAGSNPVNGPFFWEQMVTPGQPIVTITNPRAPIATFVAPVVASPTTLAFRLTVGGNNTTIAGFANVTVPIDTAPANTPIAVAATSAPANPVASGAAVTLTASAISPAGGNVTFTWTPPAGIVLTPAAPDGSVQTFTAPIVPTLAGPTAFVFTVTAHSDAPGAVDGSTTVTVVVNPQVDDVTITAVVYRQAKARLVITATDVTPNVVLTVTLDVINQATGLPWTGVMGPAIPAAPGTFSITFANIAPPNLVTVTSSGGGVATSGITILRP
ncbi:MAG TPA: hypothetical protein VFR84_03800 [Candidatus Angelobacter sp.]|nr:hypothetical protein [Candidatus Angelobacter sp.]